MKLNESIRNFINEHLNDDIRTLALQSDKYPDIDMPFAVKQIAGRQAIREKLPTWYGNENLLYPAHLSLEQCSSEHTALYKASLVSGDTLIDLTGGFGVDCAYLSRSFHHTTYVEKQEELCSLAGNNFHLLGYNNISVCNSMAEDYLSQVAQVDCIYLDPARRDAKGRKVYGISDCDPDINQIKSVLLDKSHIVLVKLSPMLDISATIKLLPETREVHVVSVNNECKELLFLLDNMHTGNITIHAVNLLKDKTVIFMFTHEEEAFAGCDYSNHPGNYLYEPNASILKSGAYKITAQRYGLKKLHPNTHLYTGDTCLKDFPGRVFLVTDTGSFNKKELKRLMQGVKQANLTVRNFPAKTDELRKRLKITDGGNLYLFATTLYNEEKCLIACEKM